MAQRISVRVSWKDNGYNGFICTKPYNNSTCMRLINIAEKKIDEKNCLMALLYIRILQSKKLDWFLTGNILECMVIGNMSRIGQKG